MKPRTTAAIAALAMATLLSAAVIPADAGEKRAHKGHSAGKAYVNPGSKDKGLAILLRDKKVPDKIKKAVRAEQKRRGDIASAMRIREREATSDAIMIIEEDWGIGALWELGVKAGTRRKGRH